MNLHIGKGTTHGVAVELKGYSDSDYVSVKDDRELTTGGVLMIGGVIPIWLCKKQGYVSLSMMEGEFCGALKVEVEMLGINEYLQELGFVR